MSSNETSYCNGCGIPHNATAHCGRKLADSVRDGTSELPEQPVGEYPPLPPRFRFQISSSATEFAYKICRIAELIHRLDN